MSKNIGDYPFKSLGQRLRRLREKQLESLAEVSGAVEIETTQLFDIENGIVRPSEDILLLLISHFATKEDEATKLWHLAGYENTDVATNQMINDDDGMAKPSIMVMPNDARIVYTDMLHVMVNNFGVVMNFMQGAGPNNQPLAVARIGMSKEHAVSVLEVLKQTLEQADKNNKPKSLPKPENQRKNQDQQ